jgi:hypothetical protein
VPNALHGRKLVGASGGELRVTWSSIYRPEWDESPDRYVDAGVVGWSRSRRLAKAEDANRRFKAYLGVQHFDPARWHVEGEARATFFLSLFLNGRTVTLRTFPSMTGAVRALETFHAGLTRCPS